MDPRIATEWIIPVLNAEPKGGQFGNTTDEKVMHCIQNKGRDWIEATVSKLPKYRQFFYPK